MASLFTLAAPAPPAAASTSTEPVVVSGTEPQWQATAVATSAPGSNGANHTCAATTAGGVKCWGNGQRGQLGDGGTDSDNAYPVDADLNTSQGTPTVPSTTTAGPIIAVAGTHSCVVVNTPSLTGAVQCWGDNDKGQLGDNTTTDRLSPVFVRSGDGPGATYLTGVTSLAAGGPNDGDALHSGQTCAVAGGEALCWGDGGNGRLGTGGNANELQPATVSGVTSGATNISMGAEGGCVVQSGTAKCWGNGADGQLGDNTTFNVDSDTPVTVKNTAGSGSLTSVVQVARSGGASACALRTDGSVVCWGRGNAGQLGNNDNANKKYPVQVSGLTSGVASIAVGSATSCAALTSGAMRCWGENGDSQIGDGTTTNRDTPTTVKDITGGGSLSRVAQRRGAIASGTNNGCAVITGGSVVCWGSEQAGNLGYGATAPRTVPFYVNGTQLPSSWKAQSISASADGSQNYDSNPPPQQQHSCAIGTTNTVRCWGFNEFGQVGDGTTVTRDAPTEVTLTNTGGSNPMAVTDSTGGPFISSGPNSSCVVVDTSTRVGGLQCWGANYDGGLGDGTTTPRTTPISVTAGEGPSVGGRLSSVTSVSTSGDRANFNVSNSRVTTCAVADGGVFCWGSGADGRLGNGANFSSPTPQEVIPVGSGATQVAVSLEHACAVVGSGVRCWGAAELLGDNAAGDRSSPVDVAAVSGGGDLGGVTSISAADTSTCATTSAGVVCWGNNDNGQLGNGTQVSTDRPVLVSGSTSSATAVAAGTYHSCAAIGGGVKCWGGVPHANDGVVTIYGRLGNGTNIGSLTPVQVVGVNGTGNLGSVATRTTGALSAGADYTCAAQTNGRAVCWGFEGTDEAFGDGRIAATSTSDNNPPVAADQAVGNVNAGATEVTNVTVTDSDRWTNAVFAGAGGDESPSVSVGTPTPGGTVTCSAFSPTTATTGTFACTYTASAAAVPGPFSYQYTVADDHGGSSSGTISGNITNQVPSATIQSVTAPRGVATQVVLAASDADASQTLAFSVVDQPSKGVVDCNGARGEDCAYTAGPGQSGTDSFTFVANDGIDDSNVATVSITITNQAPSGDVIVASAPRGVATEVVLTGSDPNADPITYSVGSQPTKGTVTCGANGVCSYTASPGSSGVDVFTFSVSDGDLSSAPATATVSITNQAPLADARAIDAGKRVVTPITLSGSDPNGDEITFEVASAPSKGALTCSGVGDADCTYQSNVGATGIDTFTYFADDGDLQSAAKTVTVTLVNAPPAANDQAVTAPRGIATPVTLTGTDGDGDTNTFTVVDQPGKGTLSCTGVGGADCSYTGGAGSTGTDSFTYRANDGEADSALATVLVTITNEAPVSNTQTVSANAPTVATPITVTANDPNGDALDFDVVTQPTKGTVSCDADGGCSYTATAGRTGTDSFSFRADDGFGGTSTATVTMVLDDVTPGVFVGEVEMLEPESNVILRGPAIPVTLSKPSATPLTIWYYTSDGSAQGGGVREGDYRVWGTPSSPRSITIPAGKLQFVIAPPVHADDLVEADESFQVHIAGVTGGSNYLANSVVPVKILDTDTPANGLPMISLIGARQYEGNSGRRVLQFRVELSRPLPTPLTVNYQTTSGTAIAGTDFKATTSKTTFPIGETARTIDVLIYPDTDVEALIRSFQVSISTSGAIPLQVLSSTATGVLIDDD